MNYAKHAIHLLFLSAALFTAGCGKDKAKTEGQGEEAVAAAGEATKTEVPASELAAKTTDPEAATEEAPPEAAPTTKCGAAPCACQEGSKNKESDDWDICKLSNETEIQGHKCAADRVVFHEDGKLQECKLTADTEIEGKPCRGTPVSVQFYNDGSLRQCGASKDIEVHGYKINKYQQIDMHEGGALRQAYLKEETREIDGIQCTAGIRWFKDGSLQMCTLASDQEIEGNKLKTGTMLVKKPNGNIRGLWNEKPIKWGKKKYNQKDRGNWLCFKDNEPNPEGFNCNSF